MKLPKYSVLKIEAEGISTLKASWVTEELVDVIEDIYNKMVERQEYESSWVKSNGEHETTDVGYAIEGAHLFLEELKENLCVNN